MTNPSLLILLPSPGTVHTPFLTSMIGLTQALQHKKILFKVATIELSDIVMSRNYLMSVFLSDERFSHALFVDSDLSFEPEQFFRLLDFDADFVAAVYPDRRARDAVLQALYEADGTKPGGRSIQDISANAMKYLMTIYTKKSEPIDVKKKNGFHTVASLAGGFSLMKRIVPEQMVDNGVAQLLPRTATIPGYENASRFADFFSHLLTDDKEAILGEDQSFCKRWLVGCGGDIWVDGQSDIRHHGDYVLRGQYAMSAQNLS